MKIKFKFLFLTCLLFLFIPFVSAEISGNWAALNVNMTINTTTIGLGSTYNISGTSKSIGYSGKLVLTTDEGNGDLVLPDIIYSRTAFCLTGDSFSISANTGSSSIQKTSIPCSHFGVNTPGYIYFIQRKFSPSTDSVYTYNLSDQYWLMSSGAQYLTFMGLNYSFQPFPQYDVNDTIIKSTDKISADLDFVVNNQGTIIYKLDEQINSLNDLKSLLNSLLNSCRDSYNVLNISDETISLTKSVDITNSLIIGNTYSFSSFFDFSNNNTNARSRLRVDVYDANNNVRYFGSNAVLLTGSSATLTVNNVNIPSGTSKVLLTFQAMDNPSFLLSFSKVMANEGSTVKPFEPHGEQICKSKLDQQIDSQNETNRQLNQANETLNNDNVDESSSEAQEFFEGFSTDTHGLTSIITAPLELIGNITSSTCSPLPLEVPFVDTTFNLPCMSSIYSEFFGDFLNIYQIITFGITAYWVCVRIFNLVKDFKNPEHDEIEVLDL